MESRVTSGARAPKMGLTLWVCVVIFCLKVKASPQRGPTSTANVVTFGEGNVIDCRRPTLAYFPDPEDCRNFYHCSDWTGLQKKSCGNLFFNPQTGVCDWPDTVRRLRPECSSIDPSTQPVTNIPKAFQTFTTEEREALKIIQLTNQPVRFPEEHTSSPAPAKAPRPQQVPVPVQANGRPQEAPRAAVLNAQSPPVFQARVPPPPPPPQRAIVNPQTFRQPLPPPPPPPPAPQAPKRNPFIGPVDPSRPQTFFRIQQEEAPVFQTRPVPQNNFEQQPQVTFETQRQPQFNFAEAPAPRPPTPFRIIDSPQQQVPTSHIRTQPKQLGFGEALPPAPPRGAIIQAPAPPPQRATEPPPPPPPPAPTTTTIIVESSTITPPQSEAPTELPQTVLPDTTTRPFLSRQQTEEPLHEEQHRLKAKQQQQHFRRPVQLQQQQQQQHTRVRIEQHQQPQHVAEEEVLEEEVVHEEGPVAPTRQRVPIASRQPVSEVTPTLTSTEAELPVTTSKVNQINRNRYSTPSPRPEFSRQRRPLARQQVPSTEAPDVTSVKTEVRPTTSLRSRFQGLRPAGSTSRSTLQPRTTTEKVAANDDAFLVCSDDTCFDPTIIEEEPDLNAAASARLPDDNLRLIFEQMALRQNQENNEQEAENIRQLLEAAKVETSEPVVVDVELEAVEDVDEIEAENLDENDKSSPSALFKPAANRPKLILANRDQLALSSKEESSAGPEENEATPESILEETLTPTQNVEVVTEPTSQRAFTLEESFTTEEVRSNREITTSSYPTTTELSTADINTSTEKVDDVDTTPPMLVEPEVTTQQSQEEKVEEITSGPQAADELVRLNEQGEEENLLVIVPSEVVSISPPEDTTAAAATTTDLPKDEVTDSIMAKEELEESSTLAPAVAKETTQTILAVEQIETTLAPVEPPVEEQSESTTMPIEEQEELESIKKDSEDATTTIVSVVEEEILPVGQEVPEPKEATTLAIEEELTTVPITKVEEPLNVEEPATTTPVALPTQSSLEALFATQNSGDAVDMILSIMQNFDLSSLVSIANENEVEPVPTTTTSDMQMSVKLVTEENQGTVLPPLTLGQILTGDTSAAVQQPVEEASPFSTLPSADAQPATTDLQTDDSQLTTNQDESFTDANLHRIENGVHVVMPVGWFETTEEGKTQVSPVTEPQTTLSPVSITTTEAPAAITSPLAVTTIKTSEVETTAPVVAEVETSYPVATEVETAAPVAAEVETSSPVVAEVETSAPVVAEVETIAPVVAEVETSAPVATEVERAAPVAAKVETSSPVEAEVETIAPVVAEVETSAPIEAEVETIAPVVAEVETSAPVEADATTASAAVTEEKQTTVKSESPEEKLTTMVTSNSEAAEQVTTEPTVVIVNGEVVATTMASIENENTLTTTNVIAPNFPETDRGGRKTLPRGFKPRSRTSTTTASTTRKTTTTTEDEAGEEEKPRFANQRNRIRQRLRLQSSGSTSATQALEILNSRAKSEQKEKIETETDVDEEKDAESLDDDSGSKLKKERTKLNVPKLVDRRNELFKKRVPITHAPHKEEHTEVTDAESQPSTTVKVVASKATPPAKPASTPTQAKPIFGNPSRRPFKLSSSAASEPVPTELTATENASTASPETAALKQKSVRCRLFRRACTDEDLSTTTTT